MECSFNNPSFTTTHSCQFVHSNKGLLKKVQSSLNNKIMGNANKRSQNNYSCDKVNNHCLPHDYPLNKYLHQMHPKNRFLPCDNPKQRSSISRVAAKTKQQRVKSSKESKHSNKHKAKGKSMHFDRIDIHTAPFATSRFKKKVITLHRNLQESKIIDKCKSQSIAKRSKRIWDSTLSAQTPEKDSTLKGILLRTAQTLYQYEAKFEVIQAEKIKLKESLKKAMSQINKLETQLTRKTNHNRSQSRKK